MISDNFLISFHSSLRDSADLWKCTKFQTTLIENNNSTHVDQTVFFSSNHYEEVFFI